MDDGASGEQGEYEQKPEQELTDAENPVDIEELQEATEV